MTDLKPIQERAEATIPGPWTTQRDKDCDVAVMAGGTIIAELGDFYPEAEFVSHAREDIPMLLKALAEARQRIAELEGRK